MGENKNERLIKANHESLNVVDGKTKYKPHDLMEAKYLPPELIELQRELLRPEHNGLFIKLQMSFPTEISQVQDSFEFLVLLCSAMEIKLDGEYNILELAKKILPKLVEERRLQNLIIVNKPFH